MCAYQRVLSRNIKCVTLLLSGGKKVRPLWGKITLNSPHLTLCGAGGHPAGLMYTARTHSRSHGARSKPWSFCGNLEGRNNDFHHVSLQRESEGELARKKVRERGRQERGSTFLSLAVGVLLSLALWELLVLNCSVSAVQPCGAGGWEGVGAGGDWYSKNGFFFLWGRGALCVQRGQSYSRSASLSLSPFPFIAFSPSLSLSQCSDWSIFLFSCCHVFTVLQFVIFNIIPVDTCQLSIMPVL